MTAYEAVQKCNDIDKLKDDFRELAGWLADHREVAKEISADVGVIDIQARVEFAFRTLAEYKSALEGALQQTEMKGCIV